MKLLSGDRIFLLLSLCLAFAGIAIFSSATLGLLARENTSISKDILIQAGLGLGFGFVMLIAARSVSLPWLKKMSPYIFIASLLMTALVFVPGIGVHVKGATRWITIGFTTLQPAELLKIGLVLVLAWWLAPRARQLGDFRKGLLPFMGFLALPSLLLLAQPNTSTTILLVATGTIMYFVAGAPFRDFLLLILVGCLSIAIIAFARPYVLDRIQTFLNPSADALGSGYQIQQSLIAVGSGGLFGRGFGQSVEKFNYLPEPQGDSVFAVFAEETGFIGAALLLSLFVLLAARGIVIAGHSRDLFGGLVALGLSLTIILQAFVNVGAMLGMIPLTGMPLPFISHGGTALVVVLTMCGLVLNVAAHRTS